jgi:hypothetical protein
MFVLVGYFFIAASAGVGASAIIGYILASMLIRRYEKADRPVKVLSQAQLQFSTTHALMVLNCFPSMQVTVNRPPAHSPI